MAEAYGFKPGALLGGKRDLLLALAAAGRMRLFAGTVSIRRSARALRNMPRIAANKIVIFVALRPAWALRIFCRSMEDIARIILSPRIGSRSLFSAVR